MDNQRSLALDHNIWRIDTTYVRPGLAACYLIGDAEEYALIECGTGLSVEPILQTLADLGVAKEWVKFIIPTHVHLDHAGGAGGLLQQLPNAHLYVHPRGARHLTDPSRLLAGAKAVYGEEAFTRLNGEILPADAERTHEAPDGTVLQLGSRELLLRDAPGHAKHHLAVWDARSQGFFTGDVFGLCYPELRIGDTEFIVPTTTPVQFDPEAWEATLAMFASYAPERMYLTHYGAVENVSVLAAQLWERLQQHVNLAQAHPEASESELASKLEAALFAAYQTSGGELSEAGFAKILKIDLDLNAQGLRHWLQAA